MNLASFEL